jgi:hypothetical protein
MRFVAKRPLKRPEAPAGPQYDFFDVLQKMVRNHGDLPLREIAKGLYATPQVLHRALVGPDLPSCGLMKRLVEVLGCTPREQEAVFQAYTEANEDRIERRRRSLPMPASEASAPPVPIEATGGPGPARTLFTQNLQALYKQARSPSLRTIIKRGRSQDPPVKLSVSSLSDWLTGKSVPSDPEAVRFLTTYLTKHARFYGRQATTEPEEWLTVWNEARKESIRRRARRTHGPVPS